MAGFCERVLVEQDAVLSIIRLVDRFNVTTSTPGAPSELPEGGVIAATLVVALKADDARGRHPIVIRAQQPSGVYLDDQSFDAIFEGEERGVNLILNLAIPAIEGLHWFEIYVNSVMLTKVPLRVIYQRVPGTP